MKVNKIIILLLNIFLINNFSVAQVYNENEKTKNNVKEQSVKEIEKAKKNKVKTRLRYAAFYNSQGKLPAKKTLTEKTIFDKNGFRKEQIRYTSLGEIDLRYTFSYDNLGRIIKMEVYDSSNKLIGKKESKYDFKGNEIERILFDQERGGPSKMIFKYDNDNNLVETKNYNDKGEIINVFKNHWENGILKDSRIEDNDGNIVVKTQFVYDNKGRLIREDVSEASNYSINYKYDSNGNLIEISNPKSKRYMNYNQNNDLIEDKLYSSDGSRQYRITFNYLKNGLQNEEIRYDNADKPAFYGKYSYEFYK
ncbi:MAG: RHS repeat protein [Melioribacteraceae bacterium]|nr:RHS repeat protein [Melioribacteraceae bacterium]